MSDNTTARQIIQTMLPIFATNVAGVFIQIFFSPFVTTVPQAVANSFSGAFCIRSVGESDKHIDVSHASSSASKDEQQRRRLRIVSRCTADKIIQIVLPIFATNVAVIFIQVFFSICDQSVTTAPCTRTESRYNTYSAQ